MKNEFSVAVVGVGVKGCFTSLGEALAALRGVEGGCVWRKTGRAFTKPRSVAFWCPVRKMVVPTTEALKWEREETESWFGVAPKL